MPNKLQSIIWTNSDQIQVLTYSIYAIKAQGKGTWKPLMW